jgi:hypothetical protein
MAHRSFSSSGLTLGGGFVSGGANVVDHSVVQRRHATNNAAPLLRAPHRVGDKLVGGTRIGEHALA